MAPTTPLWPKFLLIKKPIEIETMTGNNESTNEALANITE